VSFPVLFRAHHDDRSEPLLFDRDAWLYPYYAALKRDQGFDRLAPVLQAKALADAVQADYPAKAQEIREWNHATAIAMLTWLDTVTRTRPRYRETELLWHMRKEPRAALRGSVPAERRRCPAARGDDFYRTQLLTDKWRAERLSVEWAKQLRNVGWSPVNG
jgi:hypothetical protein